MQSKIVRFILFVSVICNASVLPAFAQKFSDLPLTKRVNLLKNKLTVMLPASAKVEPRGHSIMAAPEADEGETRVPIELGGKKVVLMANDLFALAGEHFSDNVTKMINHWNAAPGEKFERAEPATSDGGLQIVSVRNSAGAKQKADDDALLVDSVFVANKNGTVQRVAIYANPAAASNWSDVFSTAEKILKSIAPGSDGSSPSVARTIAIDKDLHFAVPANHAVSHQIGPDFDVFHCYKLIELGKSSPSLLIYHGWHPSFDPSKQLGTSDTILGQKAQWHKLAGSEVKGEEVLIKVPKSNAVVHLVATGNSDADIHEMVRVAETLAVAVP